MNYFLLIPIGIVLIGLSILGFYLDCFESEKIRKAGTVLMLLLFPGVLALLIWFGEFIHFEEATPETETVCSEIIEEYCFDETQPLTVSIREEDASEHVFTNLLQDNIARKYSSLYIENYIGNNTHIVIDKSSCFIKILNEEPVTYTLSKVKVKYRNNIILGLYKNFTQIEYHLSVPEEAIRFEIGVK